MKLKRESIDMLNYVFRALFADLYRLVNLGRLPIRRQCGKRCSHKRACGTEKFYASYLDKDSEEMKCELVFSQC